MIQMYKHFWTYIIFASGVFKEEGKDKIEEELAKRRINQ